MRRALWGWLALILTLLYVLVCCCGAANPIIR